MDTHEKLDWIINTLKEQGKTLSSVETKLDEVAAGQEQLAESVSDLGKPGSGYSIFDPDSE